MNKPHLAALALILVGATAYAAFAGDGTSAGNARAGREFVGNNCDACHVVAANQDIRPLISGYAPSFREIANRPDTTPEALRIFLSRSHGYSNMPYPDLTPSDLADTVAYIMSLRRRHAGQDMH